MHKNIYKIIFQPFKEKSIHILYKKLRDNSYDRIIKIQFVAKYSILILLFFYIYNYIKNIFIKKLLYYYYYYLFNYL